MKATTSTTRFSVRRVAMLSNAPARQSKRYSGKAWRPSAAVIEYRLYDGMWDVASVTLTGHILKQNGDPSARRHPAEPQFAWGGDPELARLVGLLCPRADGGPAFTSLADYDLSKES